MAMAKKNKYSRDTLSNMGRKFLEGLEPKSVPYLCPGSSRRKVFISVILFP